MIRRDENDVAGQPRWLLIDQIAHARLAGQLADQWHFECPWPAVVRDQLIAAVFHHDDGWAEWDNHPDVGLNTRPLNFTEMPTPVSTEIWRRSIVAGTAIGPLAIYAIAGHFRALLQRFDSWRQADAAARQAAENFIAFAEAEMETALAAWLGAGHTPQWAALSLQALQGFDALSLWFCCALRTAPENFALPNGPLTRFTPRDMHSVVVSPWPFLTGELTLEVHGWSIPGVSPNEGNLKGPEFRLPERVWWRLTEGTNSLTTASNSN